MAGFAFRRGAAVRDGLPGPEVCIIFRRSMEEGSELKVYLSDAPARTPVEGLVRVTGMRWPIGTAIEGSKSYLGIDHYITWCALGEAGITTWPSASWLTIFGAGPEEVKRGASMPKLRLTFGQARLFSGLSVAAQAAETSGGVGAGPVAAAAELCGIFVQFVLSQAHFGAIGLDSL